MFTTALFVELLVIGAGVLACVVLLVFSFFGYDWVERVDEKYYVLGLPFVVCITYVWGIITDRAADMLSILPTKLLVRRWKAVHANKERDENGANTNGTYDDRRDVLYEDNPLSRIALYGRSRARICRGWALNCLLIGICFTAFFWPQLQVDEATGTKILYLTNGMLGVMLVLCVISWGMLKWSEYTKVNEAAAFLRKKEQRIHVMLSESGASGNQLQKWHRRERDGDEHL